MPEVAASASAMSPWRSPSGQASKPTEIEITPEMIEAGFYVLLDYESDEVKSHGVVERVYRAMWAVAPQSRAEAPE